MQTERNCRGTKYDKKYRNRNCHLDHRVSIYYGFNNNAPVFIISDICNLELLPGNINQSKREKCSLTLDELYTKIFKHRNGGKEVSHESYIS